jgi:hypothetical protein
MNKFALYLLPFLTLSCSESEHPTEVLLKDGGSCRVEAAEGGANIICPNETVFISNGQNGQDACVVQFIDGNLVALCEGQNAIVIPAGVQGGQQPGSTAGTVGPQGPAGKDGKDGTRFKLETDNAGCLWMVFEDGTRVKLRGPL